VRILEFLFHLSGAISFWAEILATLFAITTAVYSSWQVSKVIRGSVDDRLSPNEN
jgi:hypothetical protein